MATKSMRTIAQRMPRELHQMVRYAAGCVVCELDRTLPLTSEQMELTEQVLRETLTSALCAVWITLKEVQDGNHSD